MCHTSVRIYTSVTHVTFSVFLRNSCSDSHIREIFIHDWRALSNLTPTAQYSLKGFDLLALDPSKNISAKRAARINALIPHGGGGSSQSFLILFCKYIIASSFWVHYDPYSYLYLACSKALYLFILSLVIPSLTFLAYQCHYGPQPVDAPPNSLIMTIKKPFHLQFHLFSELSSDFVRSWEIPLVSGSAVVWVDWSSQTFKGFEYFHEV